ncbi:MAG: hypothetical protein K0S39_4970 [Paenibacillus sp.]|jgi:hypothetical protein|nr:hypothetical protein [Paenibacillus sp.]
MHRRATKIPGTQQERPRKVTQSSEVNSGYY